MSTASIVGGTAIAGLASSAISANAAGKAADAQTAAANKAADYQKQQSQAALDFQKQQTQTAQDQQAPYLQAGGQGLAALRAGLGLGGDPGGTGVTSGSLLQPYGQTFSAPTGLTEQNDPGYQARLKLGTDAIQKSAAARGSVVTGGTAKALESYGQDYASNEYGNVYNRALSTFNTNYNDYNANQTNQYNRLATLAGLGSTTATNLANQGQAASNNVTGNLLNTGQNVSQDYNNAGAATASGYVGQGNAWSSGISGAVGNLSNLALLKNMGQNGTGMSGGTVPWSSLPVNYGVD